MIIGFCTEDVNPLGPVHEYDAPMTVGEVRLSTEPSQTGELLDGTGDIG